MSPKKKYLVELSGSREAAVQNRTAIYLGGAAIAEFVPFTWPRAVPDRPQILRRHPPDPPRGDPYPAGLQPQICVRPCVGLHQNPARRGCRVSVCRLSAYLAQAGPIRHRSAQIPSRNSILHLLGQFTVNERCIEFAYKSMSPERQARLTSTEKFGITLGSGITAGFAAAILSHVCSLQGLTSDAEGCSPPTPSSLRSTRATVPRGR